MGKRFLALALACAMALSFASCGAASSSAPAASSSTSGSATDASYTSLDDFVLWGDDLSLTKTGRDATGSTGVVSAGKYEASKIGKIIMEQGGNAVDAAVAVGFTLGFAEANATGLGGGGFMTLHIAETGEDLFINFRESAPAAATPDMWQTYTDADGNTKVIGNQNWVGGKSAGVPGFVAGLLYALDNYGTMTREQVLAPVIELANKGLTVTPTLANDMKNSYDSLTLFAESGEIFLKDVDGMKLPYEVGETFKNPDYAKTLELISEQGADVFYKGEIAESIVATANK